MEHVLAVGDPLEVPQAAVFLATVFVIRLMPDRTGANERIKDEAVYVVTLHPTIEEEE